MISPCVRLLAFVLLLFPTTVSLPAGAQIRIQAYPVEGIDYEPMPAVFVVTPRGTVKEASIEIINRKPEPLEIAGLENPSKRFDARIDALEAGRRYRLTVSLKGEGAAGKQSDTLLLKTNLKSDPVLRIPVNTYVREKVYTFPDSVFLGRYGISEIRGNPKAARDMAQVLMVYRPGKPGFQIKLTSDIPLKIQSELGPKGDQWENWCWPDPDRIQAGVIKGSIFIETNDPEFPKLTVPVTGNLLQK